VIDVDSAVEDRADLADDLCEVEPADLRQGLQQARFGVGSHCLFDLGFELAQRGEDPTEHADMGNHDCSDGSRRQARGRRGRRSTISGGVRWSVKRSGSHQEGQRTGALRFGAPRAMALTGALCIGLLSVVGFTTKTLRGLVSQLLDRPYTQSQMTYDLRRLRLFGASQNRTRTCSPRRTTRRHHLHQTRQPPAASTARRGPATRATPLRAAWRIIDQHVDATSTRHASNRPPETCLISQPRRNGEALELRSLRPPSRVSDPKRQPRRAPRGRVHIRGSPKLSPLDLAG
jgi:hypothetical protein